MKTIRSIFGKKQKSVFIESEIKFERGINLGRMTYICHVVLKPVRTYIEFLKTKFGDGH